MEDKPVNNIETNANLIRVNDRTSEIQLTLKDINGDNAKLTDTLDYFYLTNDNKHLYEVTEYSIDDHIITFKMPSVPRGLFRIEIKDSNGIIYPSGDDVEITVQISLEEGINTAYFTYQDIVTSHVEKTALKYIDEHPEKFKGQDGKDGIDGKDGKDGLNGRNGKDGIDGKDGEKGEKGDKGEKGEKGDKGGFNNERIGVNNLLDITNLTPRGTTSTYDYDLDSGLVNYSNIEWYLSQDIVLNGVKHVFRVENFLSNPNYARGRINLQMLDSDNKLIINVLVTPKEIVEVDLTGRDRQEYWVQLRVTDTELFSGFIEKPMLVEGDIPVLWEHKEVLKNNIVTLKVPENYETLQSAFDYAVYKYHNTPVNITISRGFKPKKGIIMSNVDANHVTIKSIDSTLEVDTTFTGDFLSGSYSKLPTLDCLVDMKDLGGNGVTCEKGSSGKINYNKGIKNAGGRGLYLSENSHMYARYSIFTGCHDRNVWVTRTSTFEGENGDFSSNKGGENAVYISRDSNANLLQAKINNALKNGLAVIRSFVNAESVDVSNAGETGLIAQRGSHVISEFLKANQCGVNGVRVEHGSWLSGREMTISNSGSEGILIIHGSGGSIYGSSSNSNQSDGLKLTYGSQVNASGGNFSNNTGKDISLSHGSTVQIFGSTSVFSLSNSTPNVKNTLSENGVLYSDL